MTAAVTAEGYNDFDTYSTWITPLMKCHMITAAFPRAAHFNTNKDVCDKIYIAIRRQ